MSQFAKFIKFTEMLSDAEKELGIDHLSGLDKRILYLLEKASAVGSSMSFEELNNVMDNLGQLFIAMSKLLLIRA